MRQRRQGRWILQALQQNFLYLAKATHILRTERRNWLIILLLFNTRHHRGGQLQRLIRQVDVAHRAL